MAAIENEPVRQVSPLIPEAQPAPQQWQKMPFWKKCVRGRRSLPKWAWRRAFHLQLSSVSSTIMGNLKHPNNLKHAVFNTLPMMGKASPVSLGVPSEAAPVGSQQQQVQEQRRRINAMLQDYELQRRLHSEQLQFEQAQTQQAAVQVPGIKL